MEIVTADLSKFGYRELEMARELLNAYITQGAKNLIDGITLNFNTSSGYVFLSDKDFNVYMMNGHNLEQWFNCPYCGHEGFKEDIKHEFESNECKEYLIDIGIIENVN